MYLRWFLLLIPSLAMDVFGRLLAPAVALFADAEGWLPRWLWWFQTPDNPLDGDSGHRARWPREGAFWRYLRRVAWLWRNCGYGFSFDVLGAKAEPDDVLAIFGDPGVSNRPLREGRVIRHLRRCGQPIYWQLYYVKTWPGGKRCVRINAGWKLWDRRPLMNQRLAFVCSISLTMGVE